MTWLIWRSVWSCLRIEPTFDRYGCDFESVSQGSLCARRVIVKREFLLCEV